MEKREFQGKKYLLPQIFCYTIYGDEMQSFVTNSAAESAALGERLGKALKGGETIAFFGGLGMGKTTFVSGVAKGMGISSAVSSPTFAIVNVYGNNQLAHFDMYRVETWEDLYSTGFFDYMDMGAVLCVEWSENIVNALPQDAIRITIHKGESDTQRIFEIERKGASLL